MPETRTTALADSLASLAASVTDMGLHQHTMETKLQQAVDCIASNSADIKRILTLYESLSNTVHDLTVREARTDKRPIDDAPLLPTPTMTANSTIGSSIARHVNSGHMEVTDVPPTNALKLPRIDVPTFSGENVEGWVFQLERYFDHHMVPSHQKVTIATFHMAGDALQWLQWMHVTHQINGWSDFIRDVRDRFGPPAFWDAEVSLNRLTQTSTVAAYIQDFEALSTRTPGLSATNLLHRFIAGLKDELHREIVLLCPATLQRAMGMARIAEQKLTASRSPGTRVWTGRTTPPLPIDRGPVHHPPFKPGALPFKHLTPTEMAARRERGLCFNCDDRFVPGHRCKPPRFQCYIVEEPSEIGEEQVPIDVTQHDAPTDEQTPTISYNAFQGNFTANLLRIQGLLKGKPVTVLIDSGSTHNFVQSRIAKFAGLVAEPAKHLNVAVGNGEQLRCEGICNDVKLLMAGHSFTTNFHVLPIYGADIVLGVIWLAERGLITFDYRQPWMSFIHEDKEVKLHGIRSRTVEAALSLSQLRRSCSSKAVAEYYSLSLWSLTEQHNTLPEIGTDAPAEYQSELRTVVQEYTHLFTKPSGLPPIRMHDHHIPILPQSQPVNVRPYRYPRFQKQEVEKLVTDMLADGIIRSSTSPFSSPVLLVKKRDGSWRFCVDFRALNAITVKDRFPIPTADELFDELRHARIFSKLDLRSGYHQIRMATEDIHKTAFRTHDGHYEFMVMPFGLTNAPSTFQAAMNSMLRPMLRQFVLVFMDDILIYSADWGNHIQHLRKVFHALTEHEYVVKASKCDLAKQQIQYLGHIIGNGCLDVDKDKIECITQWKCPTTLRQLRSFLGLTGYYRRFVKDYAKLAAPLTDLLRKEAFIWSANATDAFEKLKTALTSTPSLALPDFAQQFTVHTDASGTGMGAVLAQNGHPVAFYSRQFTPTIQKSSAYNRELAAIVMAVQKWRPYLLGTQFVIETDHQPLRVILTQTAHTPDQQRWISKLMGFSFEVVYRPGKDNIAADALSRKEESECMSLQGVSKPVFGILRCLRKLFIEQPEAKNLMSKVQQYPDEYGDYAIRDGLLLFQNKIWVPNDIAIRDLILHEYHDSPLGGHAGIRRTHARIAATFYWPKLRQEITEYVRQCMTCQQTKSLNIATPGLLQPLPIPMNIWDDISMDFITQLPKSEGKSVILVVVDRLTKYAHFVPLNSGFTSESVAKAFARDICRLHGTPRTIVSDRDPIFMSSFWSELFRLQGTVLAHSSAYHPQSDGQTEVLNRILEDYLRCYVAENQSRWRDFLPWAEFHYNTAIHSGLGMTPFEAVYGRKPPSLLEYEPGSASVASVEELLQHRAQVISLLRQNLLRAQNRMVQQANKHRTDVEFEKGDWVFVKLIPYRQTSVRQRTSPKLAKRYYGPFEVLDRIGKVAYRLDLPAHSRIHNVFHVSVLKRCFARPPFATVDWPSTFINGQPVVQPIFVAGSRLIQRNNTAVPQVLIQWQGQSLENATWEDKDIIHEEFPTFNLEDSVSRNGGRTDTDQSGPVHDATADGPEQPKRSARVKRLPRSFDPYVLSKKGADGVTWGS